MSTLPPDQSSSRNLVEGVKIISLCVIAAIVYGILHDQVTVRVCIEYFTIGHPPIFRTDSPTLLAVGWGIIATWWVGLILGILAALSARAGSWPRLNASAFMRPIGILMAIMGVCSLLAGMAGYLEAIIGGVRLIEPLASRVPREMHDLFLADLWAHLAAYASGLLGGITLCVRQVIKRWRMAALGARIKM